MAVSTDTTSPSGAILLMEESAEPRPPRRGFLKTVITAPAAALATHRFLIAPPAAQGEPVTREMLLLEYETWLYCELSALAGDLRDDATFQTPGRPTNGTGAARARPRPAPRPS
jgi:hypothetical protein